MTWDEPWLEEERPDYAEIPDEYNIWPRGEGRIAAAYFIGLFVVFYLFLELFGGQAILILGFPLVMWATAVFSVLASFGLYWFGWRPHAKVEPDQPTEEVQVEVTES